MVFRGGATTNDKDGLENDDVSQVPDVDDGGSEETATVNRTINPSLRR